MSGHRRVPAGLAGDILVPTGPRLLSGIADGPRLAAHRRHWAAPRPLDHADLVALAEKSGLRGRGGAAFPFAQKLVTAFEAGRKRYVVVNAAEGEPGSAKDSALLLTAPHLVLDGAELVARALDSRHVRVVVSPDRPAVAEALDAAIAERDHEIRFSVHTAGGGFVGGQARAVIELLEGRENLPVTSWYPEAVSGIKGRPTLLSNAETYAQLAALVGRGIADLLRYGTRQQPGTTLVTVAGDGPAGVVLEVPFGVGLGRVLAHCGHPPDSSLLLGGYHGGWLPPHEVSRRTISRADLSAVGASLGAGVLLPLDPSSCPVEVTGRIVGYLAGHSARRCGPCRNGLPALGDAVDDLARGGRFGGRVRELAGMVDGRGACAHPDGTVRLVRSLFTAFPAEVRAHEEGGCLVAAWAAARPAPPAQAAVRSTPAVRAARSAPPAQAGARSAGQGVWR